MPVKKMAYLLRSSLTNSLIVKKKKSQIFRLVVRKKRKKTVVATKKPLYSWTKNTCRVKLSLFQRLRLFILLKRLYFLTPESKRKIFLSFKHGKIHRQSGKAVKTSSFNTAYFAYKRTHWCILCMEKPCALISTHEWPFIWNFIFWGCSSYSLHPPHMLN